MKVAGVSIQGRPRITFPLRRGSGIHKVMLVALPLGWHDEVTNTRLIEPTPPNEAVKDKNGMHVKGADGKVRFEPNFNDPKYLLDHDLWYRRYRALAVQEMLSGDDSVEFENKSPKSESNPNPTKEQWVSYADGLVQELAASGFSDSEIGSMIHLVRGISSGVDVEEAVNDFLSSQSQGTALDPEKAS